MNIAFVKCHGLGNDFIVVDGRDYPFDEGRWRELAIRWCDRHFGIGADGLLLAWPAHTAAVRMQIFNPDGSEAEMCGNGIRAFAKVLVDTGRLNAPEDILVIETGAGDLPVRLLRGPDGIEQVSVNMGPAQLDPARLPVDTSYVRRNGRLAHATVDGLDRPLEVALVSMGNPHAVAFVEEPVAEFPLESLGPCVERHPAFPRRVNFEVVNRLPDRLVMRVWERGAGLTLACGTGACAAAVADTLETGRVGPRQVELPGGTLRIDWDGVGDVFMTGPATTVFTGTVSI